MRIVYFFGFCVGAMVFIESVVRTDVISMVLSAAIGLGSGYLLRRDMKANPDPKDPQDTP